MNERKIIEQICELLGIRATSNTEQTLKAIRNETFKNLRKGMGADWGNPESFKEDRPWVAEMLGEDGKANELFAEWSKTHSKRGGKC